MFFGKYDLIVFALISIDLLCQIIGIIFQYKGGESVHWAVVFIPLWILELVLLLTIIIFIVKTTIQQDKSRGWATIMLLFFVFAASTVFFILLSINLTYPGTYTPMQMWSPLFALLSLIIIYPLIAGIFKEAIKKHGQVQGQYANLPL